METETDHDGEDHDEDHDEDNQKPWGLVIGFTILVNLATLSGVLLFLIPVLSRKACAWVRSVFYNEALPETTSSQEDPEKKDEGGNFLDIAIPSFASGALLATSVFLIIPEGLYIIQSYSYRK